jgi:hypothetical protein
MDTVIESPFSLHISSSASTTVTDNQGHEKKRKAVLDETHEAMPAMFENQRVDGWCNRCNMGGEASNGHGHGERLTTSIFPPFPFCLLISLTAILKSPRASFSETAGGPM